MKYRKLPIVQLREPARPARTAFDEEKLDELARDIRDQGLLQPLGVRPLEDGTFEVVFGHRRLLASRVVGLAELPCVLLESDEDLHAARIAENLLREDLSPADEATYYRALYDELGQDVDRVAAVVHQTRARVEGRLLLLQGDEAVLAALRRGDIAVGVAEELNRMKRPEDRAFHLDYTVRAGATVRQVRDWRLRCNALADAPAPANPGGGSPASDSAAPPNGPRPEVPYAALARPYELSSSLEPRECMFCGRQDQEWRMFRKFVCAEDAQRYLVPLAKEAAR